MTDMKTALVIGAGHNGLVCATYLAKAGYKVDVLEARDTVGGALAARTFAAGYRVPGLALASFPFSKKIASDLGLAAAGLKTGSVLDTIALDQAGNHLTLGTTRATGGNLSDKDQKAYQTFKEEFTAYAKALRPITMNKPPRLKNMDKKDMMTLAKTGWAVRFGLGTESMREFLRVAGINMFDVLNDTFDHDGLKGAIALDAVMGQHMGPRTPNTVLTYLQRLGGEANGTLCVPEGGMSQIAESLANAARSAGATIRTGAKVARILLSDDKASGVELEDGETITADIVVSNVDARTTFLKMVGPRDLDAMFTHRISKTRSRGDVAKIHLALKGLPQIKGLTSDQLTQRLVIAPGLRYVEHAFNHAKYGEFSPAPILEMLLPSLAKASLAEASLAPAGHHVMSINASFAPYGLKDGWDSGKEDFADAVIRTIEHYAPGFNALIAHREILTPVDIENEYLVSGGHWHHGELAIDQSFMMRPVHGTAQYDTPIEGLFLCGAAAHPGGGITGIPGHNAAQRILSMGGR